jgi:hypothetical protein
MKVEPCDIHFVRAQMQRDLLGQHVQAHDFFGKPMTLIRHPGNYIGRHRR